MRKGKTKRVQAGNLGNYLDNYLVDENAYLPKTTL